MKTFRNIVILSWIAFPMEILLTRVLELYQRNVPYQIAGVFMLFALIVTGAYKIAIAYRGGMKRSRPLPNEVHLGR
jgi:hypothetical protein